MNHQTISFVKSGLRIVGYLTPPILWHSDYTLYTVFLIAAHILVASEILGIVEEVGPWQTK